MRMDGQWGYIDSANGPVISCAYEQADAFADGLARVKQEGRYGCIDQAGRLIVACEYDNLVPCSGGVLCLKDGALYAFDSAGQPIQ